MATRRLMRPHDPIQLGKLIVHIATGQVEDEEPPAGKSKTAVAPPVAAPQSVGMPGSTTTTTTVAPTIDHTTTITKGVDANGNEITKKDTYREGITGSSETHTKTFTDPDGGTTTTRSKTTTKGE